MKKSAMAAVVLMALGITGPAIGDDVEISGNVTLATDYSFRGWSQTTRDFAVQGGFDIEFEEGFSIGTWASNVNFGTDTSMELDLYAGYSSSINDEISWSVSVIRFEYPSDGDDFDYMEFGGSVSYKGVTAGLMLSTEYLGNGGPAFQYPNAQYSVDLNEKVTLDLHVGLSMVDDEDFWGPGEDSYIDFSASLTTPFRGIDLSASFVGTTIDDTPDSEPRVVVSISKSL